VRVFEGRGEGEKDPRKLEERMHGVWKRVDCGRQDLYLTAAQHLKGFSVTQLTLSGKRICWRLTGRWSQEPAPHYYCSILT
jgi:hypothetical protein